MTIAVATTLKPDGIAGVLEYLKSVTTARPINFQRRQRMLEADKRAMREPLQATDTKLELEVPIITPQISSMVAYLSRTFLATKGIFPVAAAPSAQRAASQYGTLLEKFANDWQWRRNLMLAFQDGAKYNLMAVEASWVSKKVGKLDNEFVEGTNVRKTSKEVQAGFCLRRLDLYNTFWDMSVEPAKVSEEADFAGYHEVMTTMKLRRFLESLPDNGNYNNKLTEILKSTPSSQHYYIPKVNTGSVVLDKGAVNWDTFLTDGTVTEHATMHEVTTLYARIVPKELDMTDKIPAPSTPQIWKFVIVNGMYVVYAERRTNAHDKLPIIIGQPREDGLSYQTKSLAEDLYDVQKLSSTLWSMEIESTRRIIADRGLFDPSKLRAEDINNPSPTAKIPVRNSAYGQPLSSAYFQIPYSDPGLGSRAGIAGQLTQFANAVSGQNQVQQGQFVKGNKTNDQFDQVMQNSDARQVMMALLLEDQFFTPIKELLKSDLLQYSEPVELFDKESGQVVKVDAAILRNKQAEFTIADGLIGVDKLMSTEMWATTMQTIGSSPVLAAEYKIAPMFSYLMQLQGVKNLDQFEKTEAEKAATPVGVQSGQPSA
jgi:hypothetical protein